MRYVLFDFLTCMSYMEKSIEKIVCFVNKKKVHLRIFSGLRVHFTEITRSRNSTLAYGKF